MPHSWPLYGDRLVDESSSGVAPREVELGLVAFGDLMAFDAAIADGLLLRRRMGWPERAALVSAALALALGAAAWITDSDQTAALASAVLPTGPDRLSFDDRFSPLSTSGSPDGDSALQSLDRSALGAVELKFRYARGTLARQLMSGDWRTASLDPAGLGAHGQ